MNNPYAQALINSGIIDALPSPTPVKKDFKTDVDVAQNVGHEKLAQGPYNPWGLVKKEGKYDKVYKTAAELGAPEPRNTPLPPKPGFNKEMLKDVENNNY